MRKWNAFADFIDATEGLQKREHHLQYEEQDIDLVRRFQQIASRKCNDTRIKDKANSSVKLSEALLGKAAMTPRG